MFSSKAIPIGFLCCFSISAPAEECIDGNPWEHTSSLAGAGFSSFPSTLDAPVGWELHRFSNRILPIPAESVSRVVLIGDSKQTDYIYFQSKAGPVVWYADLTGRLGVHKRTGLTLEELLESSINGAALAVRTSDEAECLEAVASLFSLDLLSDESSMEAYRHNSDYFLQGRNSDTEGTNWEVFWRDADGSLINARWRLSEINVGVLALINESDHQNLGRGKFSELMDCVQNSAADSCEEIEIEGISIVSNPDFLQ